jgi:hypothetical protein
MQVKQISFRRGDCIQRDFIGIQQNYKSKCHYNEVLLDKDLVFFFNKSG